MKAYGNQTNTYEGSTVVVEHQDKDQAAGLELAESIILCGHQAFKTHIKNIAVFIHKDDRMEVAQGRFNNKEGEGDLKRLESGMSFMQVRASMSMKEKLRQVRGAIFVDSISYVIKSAGSPIHCNDVTPRGTRWGASGTVATPC